MTLQEAIEREKSIAKSNHELADSYHTDFNVYMRQEGACRERAEYHEQLAEWLEELKQLREQWQELKETIIEMRDNDGTGTQQDVCNFLANYMDVLEKNVSGSGKPTGTEVF